MLEAISRTVEGRGDLGDGDVFQSLAMALAIRARMVAAEGQSIEGLLQQLFSHGCAAAREANAYSTGRA